MSNGKVIISGEHSVVYGELALAASVGLSVSAKVVENGGSEKNEIIDRAIKVAGGKKDTKVLIESHIPIGSGMGSSAAVSAAVVQSVRESIGNPITSKEELYDLVMECERVAHGNPSGIDAATVVYGGVIAFTKGKPFEKLRIPNSLDVLLINTGKPNETTKEMVELVASKPNKDKITREIGEITRKMKSRLINGENVDILLNQNGYLLEELGVVGKRAISISKKLRADGYSVKVTGAGGVVSGSGMLIIRAENYRNALNYCRQHGLDFYISKLGD